MATIEGNEVALRNVLGAIVPPVRNGQAATVSQDDVGPPFYSATVALSTGYTPNAPNTVAPGWVYGLCVDNVPDGVTVYASFGNGSNASETIALAGQVMLFPRGARRVFLRADAAATVTVTWFLDRFADKRYSPKSPGAQTVAVVNTVSVQGTLGGIAVPVSGSVSVTGTSTVQSPTASAIEAIFTNTGETDALLNTGEITTGNRTQMGFGFLNGNSVGDRIVQVQTKVGANWLTMYEVTVPAGELRFYSFGPGMVRPLPLPTGVRIYSAQSGTTGGGQSVIGWYFR